MGVFLWNLGRCRIAGSIVHDVSIDASGSFVASAWQAGVSWNELQRRYRNTV